MNGGARTRIANSPSRIMSGRPGPMCEHFTKENRHKVVDLGLLFCARIMSSFS